MPEASTPTRSKGGRPKLPITKAEKEDILQRLVSIDRRLNDVEEMFKERVSGLTELQFIHTWLATLGAVKGDRMPKQAILLDWGRQALQLRDEMTRIADELRNED